LDISENSGNRRRIDTIFADCGVRDFNARSVPACRSRQANSNYTFLTFSEYLIWINPESAFQVDITAFWDNLIQSNGYNNKRSFDWSDEALINSEYKLDATLIEPKLFSEKIDFLLLTYMKPKHRNLSSNQQKDYPIPQEIAEEIKTSGYSTYFYQNSANGIITSDDKEISKHIK